LTTRADILNTIVFSFTLVRPSSTLVPSIGPGIALRLDEASSHRRVRSGCRLALVHVQTGVNGRKQA
jgi:hypothetical protein